MNIYDFDGTIYRGDSTIDFLLFSIRKNPALLRFLPGWGIAAVLYKLKRIDKTQMKERVYHILSGYDAAALLDEFWECHEDRIYPWYLAQGEKTDIVISASPDFLLRPICGKLGICHLIASRVDVQTGKYRGRNCRGQEKVVRLKQELGIESCDAFYSDSHSDQPLAEIANVAFLIKNGEIHSWK